EALHRKVSATGAKTRANRVVALLSTMLNLAVRWEYIERNTARGAVDRNPETKRRRYLSPAEIAKLSATLAECSSPRAADAIRLLLLTGARKTEVLAAKWSQFDLEGATWSKPGSTTKTKTDHHVPLSAPALALLSEMRARAKSEYLFPGRDGAGYLNIRTSWESVRRAAALEDVHLHDL